MQVSFKTALKSIAATLFVAATINAGFAQSPLLRDPNFMPDKPDLSGLPRLRFLTSLDFPPFNFADANKKPTGFNVELARAICATLDIEEKCEIQALPWDELRDALIANRGEAIIAGTALSASARREMALTRTYFRFPARFVGLAQGNAMQRFDQDIASGLEGKKVIVEDGTAHAAMLETHFPKAIAISVANLQAGYDELKSGDADYLYADGVSLSFFIPSQAAESCCTFVGGPYFDPKFTGHGMSIALRVEDKILLQAVEHALSVIQRDGIYDEIFNRNFPLSPYVEGASGL